MFFNFYKIAKNHFFNYPTPVTLNSFWNFGFLLTIVLVIQIVSGLLLAIYYVPNFNMAFESVEYIMREVNYGWLIRYIHSNGASFFFVFTYIHIARGIYYNSYSYNKLVWISGVIILFLLMAVSFIGYVLPWGQMSYWGATVITNLVTVLPVIGKKIVYLLWGDFSVSNATLNRFFVLHFILPFIILFFVVLHFIFLHDKGSYNPLRLECFNDKINFYPYFLLKDLVFLFLFLLIYFIFILYFPNVLGHSDNYIPANIMSTPEHIVPEWYFLPYYAILRSIPNKALGVLAMLGSLLVLVLLPSVSFNQYLYKNIAYKFKLVIFINVLLNKYAFFIFNLIFILLMWLGAMPVKEPYITVSQILVFFYFFYFFYLLFISKFNLLKDKKN